MKSRICHIPDKETDGKIAARLGWTPDMGARGWNPAKVASLRGLYDSELVNSGQEPLDVSDIDKATKALMEFRKLINLRTRARVKNSTFRINRCYDVLRHVYSLHERQARIRTLSHLFSCEVDRLMGNNTGIERQQIINGFATINGEYVGGEISILDGVYNKILQLRTSYFQQMNNAEAYFKKAKEDNHLNFKGAPTNAEEYRKVSEYRFNEYTKILENWEQFIPFVLKDLVQKEGVKLGIKKEYAAAASSDNFGENDIAAKWDMSESKRDGWMENSDLQSAFGSVGKQVRRILATVPQVEQEPIFEDRTMPDGSVRKVCTGFKYVLVIDDLGWQTYMHPIKTHQFLVEFLKGIQDSDDMMNRLCKADQNGEAKISWMQPLVEVLRANPQARTQFFYDFKKNFQVYSEMFEDKDESVGLIKSIKTKIINKAENILKGAYELSMTSRGKHPTNVKLWGYEPVFEEGKNGKGGEVNWQRLADLREKVLEWTDEGDKLDGTPDLVNHHVSLLCDNGRNAAKSYNERRDFLMEVFTSLGYDVEMDTIDKILQSTSIYNVRNQLRQLFDPITTGNSGFIYAMGNVTRGDFRTLCSKSKSKKEKSEALARLNDQHVEFRKLYSTKKGGKVGPVKEHSEKIIDIINKYQQGYRIESRARYMGNTMYSFVAPSYLGDRLETIKSYVDADDKKGLLTFLKNEYLQSPFFVDSEYISSDGHAGRIFNYWLREMVEACNSNAPLNSSVASIFTFERDLGSTDKNFEDFTTKEHATDMLIHFFADENQNKGYGATGSKNLNKKQSALYPVFILGDAGVSKYIRAPRISTPCYVDDSTGKVIDPANTQGVSYHREYRFDTRAEDQILDSFYDIYLQELSRMAMDDSISLQMYANGKKVKHVKGSFSILTFLNRDAQDYNEKYSLPIDPLTGKYTTDESTIKEIIKQYLDDAALNGISHEENGKTVTIPSFKQRMETLGVLETASVNTKRGTRTLYKTLSNVATPENIDGKIREFYWNTKLATAQQFQLMTIDPSFYHGTKDLQKRYKEIHAPGSILDTKAKDFNGELYSKDGIERVIYFDDISINAEDFNPEFMEVILRTFATKGKENEVEAAIKDGVLKPKQDKGEELARQDRLKELLGENWNIYSAYTANTLTDGQGYRTLDSYRKVKGMAGQWTEDMETAYRHIKRIAANIEAEGREEARAAELNHIASELNVVLQPIKPYMFTHEKYPIEIEKKVRDMRGNLVTATDRDGKPIKVKAWKYIPVQHKYAEALIIPELMPKGNKLKDLAKWMDKNNIDMVGSTKIAKVGCFGQVQLSQAKNASDIENIMSQGYVHQLPYRDYRIQTNVPEHINSSQLFGTQVRKLIMADMPMDVDKSFYVDGHEINLSVSDDENDSSKHASATGRNIIALYNSLICANIFDSYETFAQNAGNIKELSKMLQQSTIGSMREAMDNLFSYVVAGTEKDLQKFMIPLYEGGLEHDAAALILSTFKKIVNKQQICGGSAVQVSAFGINGYAEDGNLRYVQDPDNKGNILYVECEMPFDKTFNIDVKLKDGTTTKQKTNLDFRKYCYSEGKDYGIPLPSGQPIEKTINGKTNPEWKKYQSYTYKEVNGQLVAADYNDPEAKVYKPLIEEEYPDILSILAYRIPTERDYSMLNLKVKRFTSKVAGGTLKVPPQGTTIAGFDFDIDKLYFMVREYHKHYNDNAYTEKYFSENQKKEIWSNVYDNHRDVWQALLQARREAELADPSLTRERKFGSKTIKVSTTPLNAYWEKANIEEKFGLNKSDVFRQSAKEVDAKPMINEVKGESSSWMEEYDFSKSPEENTRASRNNLLITLIQQRLMDPETVKRRYTPGGFARASKAARFMRELIYGDLSSVASTDSNGNITGIDLSKVSQREGGDTDPEPNYDPTDPYTILVYNQQNQVARKLIGIFANQNTNHAFASVMDVFELSSPIAFCGQSYTDLLHKTDGRAADIDLNMAEFLAASVDAVKDPVLNFLNLNTITADAGALLARLGYNTKEIGLLFNQPIIKRICEESFNTGKNINTVISDNIADLSTHLIGNDKSVTNLSENDLALSIVNERKMKEEGKTTDDFLEQNAAMQVKVLELFSDIQKASQDISEFVLNTKFTASNAVSSTFGGLYAQQLKVQKYLDRFPKNSKDKGTLSYNMVVAEGSAEMGLMSKPIENNPEYITMSKKQYLRKVRYNPFAYEQAMFDTNRKVLKLLSKYFPYETPLYQSIRGRMQELAQYGTLSEDDINDIHSNIPVALLAMQKASMFNGEAAHMKNGKVTNMTNREHYRTKFAEDLAAIVARDENLKELDLFKYLYPIPETQETIDPKTGLPNIKETWRISMQDVGGIDADTKELIREAWAYLMEVDEEGFFVNEDYAELARDLFMYCFYQLGFNYSPISFMHLVPTQVKDFIKVEREDSIPVNTFIDVKSNENGPSDDVFVFRSDNEDALDKADLDFGAYRDDINKLSRDAFQLEIDDKGKLSYSAIISLVYAAKSHPERKFKIDADLTEEEFARFVDYGGDIPSNIYFRQNLVETYPDIASSMSYGKERTYREFLNDILEGKETGLNIDEFAKMFILNHLDNSRFVVDTSMGKGVKDFIKKQLAISGNSYMEGAKIRPYITIDLSTLDNENGKAVASKFANVKALNGHIISAKWAPCIKINNSYYIADSQTDMGFNVNSDLVMTYKKVEPLGSTKAMTYDLGSKLSPRMVYKTSLDAIEYRDPNYVDPQTTDDNPDSQQSNIPVTNDASENTTPEPNDAPNNTGTASSAVRQILEDYIFNEFVAANQAKFGPMQREDLEELRNTLTNASFQDLSDTAEAIKKACRKNGIMTLDDEGNPMKGC